MQSMFGMRSPSSRRRHTGFGRAVGGPWLVLAGIAGRAAMLERALDATRMVQLDGVVVIGDSVLGQADAAAPDDLDPYAVWQRLQGLGAVVVRGPTDEALARIDDQALKARARLTSPRLDAMARLRQVRRTRDALGDVLVRRVGDLPLSAVVSMADGQGLMAQHAFFDAALAGWSIEAAAASDRLSHIAEDALAIAGLSHDFAHWRPDGNGMAPYTVAVPGLEHGVVLAQCYESGDIEATAIRLTSASLA